MRYVPPASLLVPIAGIGFSFLGVREITGNFGQPIVGFLPLLFIFIGWYAQVKLLGCLPPAFTAMAIGTALAWIDPVTR
jgi:AGZA family xanthine/uracil permease-like MFS transporter